MVYLQLQYMPILLYTHSTMCVHEAIEVKCIYVVMKLRSRYKRLDLRNTLSECAFHTLIVPTSPNELTTRLLCMLRSVSNVEVTGRRSPPTPRTLLHRQCHY